MTIRPLLIIFCLYGTPQESREACRALGADAIACAIPTNGNQCTIHMPEMQIGYKQDEILFIHEVKHCYFGSTH